MHQESSYESKTRWVVLLTAVTMVVEIVAGKLTGSMALLADGIHMGSHVLAIGLSWIAYVVVRRLRKSSTYKGDSEKVLSLAGFTSGILLLVFAIAIIIEAGIRFANPIDIEFREAIFVAIIGLLVNIASAILLSHDGEKADNNIKAAYIHVISDAITSVAAILGLLAAMIWGISYIDTLAAVISSLVIIKWSIGLLITSGKHLTGFEGDQSE